MFFRFVWIYICGLNTVCYVWLNNDIPLDFIESGFCTDLYNAANVDLDINIKHQNTQQNAISQYFLSNISDKPSVSAMLICWYCTYRHDSIAWIVGMLLNYIPFR